MYEEEKYLSAVREEPGIYGKVCPTAGETLPERGSRRLILLRQQKASSDPDTVCSQVLAQLLRVLTEENTCHSFLLCCFHIDGRIINEYTFLCTQRKPLQKGLIDSRIWLQKPHLCRNQRSIHQAAGLCASPIQGLARSGIGQQIKLVALLFELPHQFQHTTNWNKRLILSLDQILRHRMQRLRQAGQDTLLCSGFVQCAPVQHDPFH